MLETPRPEEATTPRLDVTGSYEDAAYIDEAGGAEPYGSLEGAITGARTGAEGAS